MKKFTPNPYNLLSNHEVYRNPWIRVVEEQVERKDGWRGQFSVVEIKSGVLILPVTTAGEVHLVREFKYAVARESLELAGGGIEDDEIPLEAAKRELAEELGMRSGNWISLGKVAHSTTLARAYNHLFLTMDVQRIPDFRADPWLTPVTMPFTELLSLVMSHEILDAESAVCILKAAQLLASDKV